MELKLTNMSLFKIFPKSFVFTIFIILHNINLHNADDALDHIKWRNNINKSCFPKYWMAYIKKFLGVKLNEMLFNSSSFINNLLMRDTLKFLNMEIMNFHTYAKQVQFLVSECNFTFDEVMEKHYISLPIISIELWRPYEKIHSAECLEEITYELIFTMDASFTLNISFEYLVIIEIFKNCVRSSLSVESFFNSTNSTTFLFCGIHSQFNLYPPSYCVSLSFNVHDNIMVDVKMHYSVISSNVIESKVTQQTYEGWKSLSIHQIIIGNAVIETYRLEVRKYQGISLRLELDEEMTLFVIVGPDYLSNIQEYTGENKLIHIRSFQCLLQTLCRILKTGKILLYKVKYWGHPATRIKLTLNQDDSQFLTTFPGMRCITSDEICVLYFKSLQNYYINLKMLSFSQDGSPDYQCNYGGISVYDLKVDIFEEKLILCNKYNHPYYATAFEE